MERIKMGGNGHKLSMKQKIVRWLLKDAHIDELHIGAHSIVLDGDKIKMTVLDTDPATPAEGWIWFLGGATHKPRHHDGTSVKDIGEGATPGAHKATHENGGADEITVAGLSGELADNQPPKAHATDHKSGGGDEIKLNELGAPTAAVAFNSQKATGLAAATGAGDAIVADANVRAPDSSLLEGSNKATVQDHTPKAHLLGAHTADTLANLNAKISDATLDDASAARTPSSHDRTKHSDIDQSLLSTDNVAFAQVTVGDLVLKNGYRFTEHKKYGVCLKSPKGELYKLVVERC